jgi:hypothetical protein
MKALKLIVSPAALCLWAIIICISFSVASSDASRTLSFRQESKFGYAKSSFPVQMKRWDEPLFNLLMARAKTDMAEFLKSAEQDAAARPTEGEIAQWKPYTQSVGYLEQFRTLGLVSYLEITTMTQGDAPPAITFKTVNFDKAGKRELGLGDILDGAADRSKTLQALAEYARADLKDQMGEDEDSESLLDLTKPDLGVYERFTLCPSTKIEKAAGLTIHFPPSPAGLYAGSDFHVTIPYTVFSKFLKPGMKPLFSGESRQAPVSLQDAVI